jgi:hypothetical protein
VIGDGLLAAADGMRRSLAGTTFTLRTVVLVVVVGLEAVATDTLRVVGAVPGEGESLVLTKPSRDVVATAREVLSSSQGSLFAVVRGVSFLRSGSGVGFDRVLDLSDALLTLPSISAGRWSIFGSSATRHASSEEKVQARSAWARSRSDSWFNRWVRIAVCVQYEGCVRDDQLRLLAEGRKQGGGGRGCRGSWPQ